MGFFKPNVEKMRAKKDVKGLIKALKDENFRKAAVRALGEIGDDRAVEPLIKVLKDDDEAKQIRKAAVRALGEIRDNRAVEPLIWALKDESKQIRKAAAQAFGRMKWKPKNDVEKAWYLVAKSDWEALVKVGEAAVEPLIQALKDEGEDSPVRGKAALALGEIGDARAVGPLIQALKQEYDEFDYVVREAAIQALGELGDQKAVKPLIDTITDNEYSHFREAAVLALAKLGDSNAKIIADYIKITDDIPEDIKKRARILLKLPQDSSQWAANFVVRELRDELEAASEDDIEFSHLEDWFEVVKRLLTRRDEKLYGFLVEFLGISRKYVDARPRAKKLKAAFTDMETLYEHEGVYEKWLSRMSTDELITEYRDNNNSEALLALLRDPSPRSVEFIEQEISSGKHWPSLFFELVEEVLATGDKRFYGTLAKFYLMADEWASEISPGFQDWEDWELKRMQHKEVSGIKQINAKIIKHLTKASDDEDSDVRQATQEALKRIKAKKS